MSRSIEMERITKILCASNKLIIVNSLISHKIITISPSYTSEKHNKRLEARL